MCVSIRFRKSSGEGTAHATGTKSFRGAVVQGRGLAVERMATASMKEAIKRITDISIVPGTLNVRLPGPFDGKLRRYITVKELGGIPEISRRKGLRFDEVVIAGRFRGFVFQGDEPEYPANQVELISDSYLREQLGLRDGDEIGFTMIG